MGRGGWGREGVDCRGREGDEGVDWEGSEQGVQ